MDAGPALRLRYRAMDLDAAEQEKIRRAQGGDREAFGSIVEAYGPRLLAFCRARLGSEEEARDAAQDVFLRSWSAIGRFRLGESFPAWLFAIAANHVRNRFRLRASESRKESSVAGEAAAAAIEDPAAAALESLRAESLRKAVSALPGQLRSAVELYYFAGLDVTESAAILGLGEEAVKSRLFRARKKLRAGLESPQPDRAGRGILR
jgi:RNA polymerase sigma-70 factor, ECF subfamily